jgi:hypothetical protein
LEKEEELESSFGGWSEWKDFGVDYRFGIDSPERLSELAVSKALK